MKNTTTWRKVREIIITRDESKCRVCNKHTSQPQVDHIRAICLAGDLYDLNNLQVLCKRCHDIKTGKDKVALNTSKGYEKRTTLIGLMITPSMKKRMDALSHINWSAVLRETLEKRVPEIENEYLTEAKT